MTAEGVPHAGEPSRAGPFPQEDATLASNQSRRGDVNHVATKDIVGYSFFSEIGRFPSRSPPKDSCVCLPVGGAMEAVAQEIAERLRPAPFVRIVTHIDTDGITGGAIASEALDRAGISHEVAFVKKLDEAVLTELKRKGTPLVWFIDLGAGMLHALHGLDAVITDHHVPTEREVPKVLRSDLMRFAESQDRILMLNPHLEGAGSDVASGAGCAYAVARALASTNRDLAAVAIVGAVGA